MPPAAVAATLAAAQAAAGLAHWYTDVASVKQLPVAQARALGCDMTSYVPGHPLAGREKHGPAAARADLFLGRTWALCPARRPPRRPSTRSPTLVRACGAVPMRADAAAHDRWVALISHAPHLVAAAMAARLEAAPPEALDLAGQGLRDVTRIAAGDTGLWTQILAANAEPVAEVLAAVAADLAEAARMLTDGDPKSVATLLDRGQAGVARIPGKHGGAPREFAVVQVVIRDQPGELARLFDAAGAGRRQHRGRQDRALARAAGRRGRALGPPRRGRPAAGRTGSGRLAGPPLAPAAPFHTERAGPAPADRACRGRCGSHRKKRTESSRPPSAQAPSTARSRPDQPADGWSAWVTASIIGWAGR